MRRTTDTALPDTSPAQIEASLLRYLAEMTAPVVARRVDVSWVEIADQWLGLGRDAPACRTAYDAVLRLHARGRVRAEFDWHGVSWIEASTDQSADEPRREVWDSSVAQWTKKEVTVNIFGNVGNVNTGIVMGNMEANLQQLSREGHADLAADLQHLVQAVMSAAALSDDQKKEVVEQLAVLSSQAAVPAEQRQVGTVRAVINGLKESLSVSGSLASLWSAFGPKLLAFFGL